jgi:DNA-binding IscR family transcriptional regulator
MPTNSQFAVAIHILVMLAKADRPLTSRIMSGSINTNPVVVRRIVGSLGDAGLVKTQMVSMVARCWLSHAEKIALLDVYRATGQGDVLPTHSSIPSQQCMIGANIQAVLAARFEQAQAALEAELSAISIADVAEDIQQQIESS